MTAAEKIMAALEVRQDQSAVALGEVTGISRRGLYRLLGAMAQRGDIISTWRGLPPKRHRLYSLPRGRA